MRIGLALAGVLAATPTLARPPAYSHRAGATPEQFAADGKVCWDDAVRAMKDPKFANPWLRNPATEGTVAGAAGAGIARGLAAGIEGGKRFKLTYYDCTYAKGYTLRRPDEAAWKAYRKLGKPERAALMRQWETAPEPLHPEAPRDEFD